MTAAEEMKIITVAIATAIAIINMTDDKHVQVMAAHMAETLATITED